MPDAICFDASVLVKLCVPEPGGEQAKDLLDHALREGRIIVGPSILWPETLSTLRKLVARRMLSTDLADRAAQSLLLLPIEEVSGPEVYRRAWRIASELGLPTLYDAVYLAVAEFREALFWTADRRLAEAARGKGYLRLLGR